MNVNHDKRIGDAYRKWKESTTCQLADVTSRQLQLLWDAFSAGWHAGNEAGWDDAEDYGDEPSIWDNDERWEADV